MTEYGWVKTEHYHIREGETAELAQKLLDTGLLYWINAAVLHNFGLALGVSVDDETGEVVDGLALNLTEDPNGVWFDEETTEEVRTRMRATGLVKNVSIDD
jgi:hypothetical protein